VFVEFFFSQEPQENINGIKKMKSKVNLLILLVF